MSRHLYLAAVGGGVLSFAAALAFGVPPEWAVLGWSLAVLAAGAWLDRLMPFEPRWNRAQGDVATDAASALVLIGLVDPLLKAFLPLAVLALLPAGQPATGGWALGGLPFAAQVLVALLWMEFGKYWSHRAHHRLGGLWSLHALHHGSKRLYWLNNFRLHPLNHLLNTLAGLLPPWLLGAPTLVLLGATAVAQPVLMLQHTNARLRSGWLNWVFSTNEVHRWHHSACTQEADSNFGGALVLWAIRPPCCRA